MVKTLPESQKIVPLNELILSEKGSKLTLDSYILDFGCGSGRHIYEYLDNGYKNIYGFDKENYVNLSTPSVSKKVLFNKDGDMTKLPFPDNYFDFVYSNSVFEHIIEQEISFKEIHRVLKSDGVPFISSRQNGDQ